MELVEIISMVTVGRNVLSEMNSDEHAQKIETLLLSIALQAFVRNQGRRGTVTSGG